MGVRRLGLALGIGLVAVLAWLAQSQHQDEQPPTPTNAAANAPGPAVANSDASRRHAAAPVEPNPVRTATTAAATTPRSDMRQVRLRVLNPDQTPVPGATVTSAPDLPEFVKATDEEGYCTFHAPATCDEYNLRITSGERRLDDFWEPAAKLTATLPWLGPLRGIVVDADTREPVANARIRFDDTETMGLAYNVRSDASGSFTMPLLPRDQELAFRFDAEGYPRQYDLRILPGTGDTVTCTFAIDRGTVLSGRFLDATTRAPVPGVEIRQQLGGDLLGTSDATGRFSMRVHTDPAGRIGITASPAGYCKHTFIMPHEEPVRGFALDDYPLIAASKLIGRVQSSTGAAVSGANVQAMCRGEAEHPLPKFAYIEAAGRTEAKTDAHGMFAIDGLEPHSQYRLRVTHEDFKTSPRSAPGNTASTHPGVPIVTITMQPKPPASVHGTIVGTYRCNGKPTAGTIRWVSRSERGYSYIDEQGSFCIERVPSGAVQLQVSASRFEGAMEGLATLLQLRKTVALAAGQEVRVAFEHEVAETTITGTVTQSDGTPMADQAIRGKAPSFDTMLVRTDADGAFSLPVPIALPSVTVRILEDDMTPQSQVARPGDTGVRFVALSRIPSRIRAKGPDGRLLRPSILALGSWPRKVRSLGRVPATDPAGFSLVQLPHGTRQVVLGEAGHAISTHSIEPSDANVIDTVLPRSVKLTLRLVSDQEETETPVHVRLLDAYGTLTKRGITSWGLPRTVQLQHAGASIDHVGPGTHRLVIEDPKLEIVPDTVEVTGTDLTVDLRVRKKQQ